MVAAELGVRPWSSRPREPRTWVTTRPYLDVACRFSTARTAERLGIAVPPLEEYLPALLEYAAEARWGKRPRPRARLHPPFARRD